MLKILDKNPDVNKYWIWVILSKNHNITLNNILSTPHLPWFWTAISENTNISLNEILTHKKCDWDWLKILQHDNLTLEFIEEAQLDINLDIGIFLNNHMIFAKKQFINNKLKKYYDIIISKVINIIDINKYISSFLI